MKLSARNLLALVLFLSAGIIFAQSWTKISGTAPFVHRIYFPPSNPAWMVVASDSIFVENELSTNQQRFFWDKGPNNTYIVNGFRISQDSGQTFGAPILEGHSVRDIIESPSSQGTWLAAIARNTSEGGILISTDNGSNWSGYDSVQGFSSRCGNNLLFPYVRLASHGSGNRVYSLMANQTYGFRSSENNFTSCEGDSVYTIARDLSASTVATGHVFIADMAAGIRRSTNFGDTWETFSQGLENIRVLSVFASRSNPNIIYAGGDSLLTSLNYVGRGIYRSLDSGRTWQWVGAPGARIWQIRDHPLDPRYVIAAGDSSGVWISGNYGRPGSWQQITSGIPQNMAVHTVGFPRWSSNGGVIAFAGVNDINGGLYRSDRIFIEPSSVENEEKITDLEMVNISPQPSAEYSEVRWAAISDQPTKIILRDVFGQEIFSSVVNSIAGNANTFRINTTKLTQGTYFVTLEAKANSITEKIIVIH